MRAAWNAPQPRGLMDGRLLRGVPDADRHRIAVLNIRRHRRKKMAGSSDGGSHSDSSDSDPSNGAGGVQLPGQHPAAPPPPPSGHPSGPPPTSNGRPRMQLQLSDSICKLTGVTRVVHVPVAKVQEGRGILFWDFLGCLIFPAPLFWFLADPTRPPVGLCSRYLLPILPC